MKKQKYEYDLMSISDTRTGLIDLQAYQSSVEDHAREGWKLHTVFRGGTGAANATGVPTGQSVLVFERPIRSAGDVKNFMTDTLSQQMAIDNITVRFIRAQKLTAQFLLKMRKDREMTAINIDVEVKDKFSGSHKYQNVILGSFEEEADYLVSDEIDVTDAKSVYNIIKEVTLKINEYVDDQGYHKGSADLYKLKETDTKLSVMDVIETLGSSKEIYEYLAKLSITNKNLSGAVDLMQGQVEIEERYGNHKEQSVMQLKRYFEVNPM